MMPLLLSHGCSHPPLLVAMARSSVADFSNSQALDGSSKERGQGLTVPADFYESNSFCRSPGQSNSLGNGTQVVDSSQVQPNYHHNVQEEHSSGSWNLNLAQHHMMNVVQAQSNTRLPANPKHKLESPSGEVLAAKSARGSCMASLEQALFHQSSLEQALFHQSSLEQALFHQSSLEQALLHQSSLEQALFHQSSLEQALVHQSSLQHICQRGSSLHVELTGKPLMDLQGQIFKHEQTNQNNQHLILHEQNSSLKGRLSGSEAVIDHFPPHISSAAALVDTLKPSDVHWKTLKQRAEAQPELIGSSSRRFVREEGGQILASDVPTIVENSSSELVNPSRDLHPFHRQGSPSHLSDLLPPPAGSSSQQQQFFAVHRGQPRHSNNHCWSSEVSPTLSEVKGQEAGGARSFTLWKNGDTTQNREVWGDLARCNKRDREMREDANMTHLEEYVRNDAVSNQIGHGLAESKRIEKNRKYQVHRAMVQKNSSEDDKESVLGEVIDLVEGLDERPKESGPFSYASHENLVLHRFESSSLMQGVNHANLRQQGSHQAVQQHELGEEIGGNGGRVIPLVNMSDVSLDNAEGLDGFLLGVLDGIPQIEVRMMENQQVMIKLSSKDRPGLFADIMFALEDLQLQVQHVNIRTVPGVVYDVFAAKVNVSLAGEQTTSNIADTVRRAIDKGNTAKRAIPTINSHKRSLQFT